MSPSSVHVKVLGETDIEVIEQLSVLKSSTSFALIVTAPLASRWASIFLVIAIGFSLSIIVTVDCAVAILPLLSITERVTVLIPKLLQSKLFISKLKVNPQLSELPLSISLTLIEACPFESRFTVKSFATAIGVILSSIVTIAWAVVVFPFPSFPVIVTICAIPTWLQLKVDLSKLNETLQLSLEEATTSLCVIDALPVASSRTVKSLGTIVGEILSITVTIEVFTVELLLASVAVIVTVWGKEISEQSKVTLSIPIE